MLTLVEFRSDKFPPYEGLRREGQGRPWLSATAMILVPLPRLVLPTPRPPFCGGEGALNEGLADIKAAPRAKILGEGLQDPSHHTRADPLLRAAMTRLIRRIMVRQIAQGAPGAQNIQYVVQDVPLGQPRSAAPARGVPVHDSVAHFHGVLPPLHR